MNQAINFPVEPRARSPYSGDPHPLIDLVLEELDTNNRTIRIVGQGTRTAIAFLKDALKDYRNIHVVEKHETVKPSNQWDLAVFSSSSLQKRPLACLELRLADWGKDEVIEYLLNVAPQQCKSVMSRLQKSNDFSLGGGSPRVLSAALDRMIESQNIASVEEGIKAHFEDFKLTPQIRQEIIANCINNLFSDGKTVLALRACSHNCIGEEEVKFLSNQTVRYVVCIETLIQWFEEGMQPGILSASWPRELLTMAAEKIKGNHKVISFLNMHANEKDSIFASNSASLLVAADKSWTPSIDREQAYENAKLANVNWPNQSFKEAAFNRADLSNSNLQNCDFEEATLTSGNFYRSCISGANFTYAYAANSNFSGSITRAVSAHGASFPNSNFSEASLEASNLSNTNFNESDLSNANLSSCNLKKAQFIDANFNGVNLANALMVEALFKNGDLRNANLGNADFTGASMDRCDLRFQKLEGAIFQAVKFKFPLFTGSVFRNCDMRNVNLYNAKMAQIEWEYCDLRNANFFSCQFHMGSTRCGTLDSPFPSHGTRTGYYTDDFDDHYFKQPEERRVASLRGCNLMGAEVFYTDFYLVDLREAIYDAKQKAHFKNCDAILTD